MLFAAPTVTREVAPAAVEVSLDEAVALVAARHRAGVTLVVRNPVPFPSDPADVNRWRAAAQAVEALPESLRVAALNAFWSQHHCRVLAACPMAERRRGR